MRGASKLLTLVVALAAAGACKKSEVPQDQNIVVDNGNIPENADVETLPPDESSGTPTDELVNGDDDPYVNEANASSNSY